MNNYFNLMNRINDIVKKWEKKGDIEFSDTNAFEKITDIILTDTWILHIKKLNNEIYVLLKNLLNAYNPNK